MDKSGQNLLLGACYAHTWEYVQHENGCVPPFSNQADHALTNYHTF